ncbi:unnamed protein product [Lupinus luteus]|uniref:Alpha/beta hydrolase fold-3 domain-containing protein n=1 Tax=Lupinus luteus TaxID=3873 RepID=A0AAV1XLD0_LUPLU
MANSNSNSTNSDQSEHIIHDFPGYIRVFSNGFVERLRGTEFVPPFIDQARGVSSKDIIIDPQHNVPARLFLPNLTTHTHKLPLLLYFHGGAFCVSSNSAAIYHNYMTDLVAKSKVLAVSVNYRLAPEHPIPAAYEDSWAALQWVASHKNNTGPEAWLNEHADFERVFLGGESSGANIVHNIAMVAGHPDLELGIEILGACLVHPYFWGSEPIGSEALTPDQNRKAMLDKLWPFVCPSMPDNDDPRVNPVAEGAPSLARLCCKRMLVCVAEKDVLRDRGWLYYNALGRSGWPGVVQIEETLGEGHAFHLYNLGCNKAQDFIKRLAEFYNRDMPPEV